MPSNRQGAQAAVPFCLKWVRQQLAELTLLENLGCNWSPQKGRKIGSEILYSIQRELGQIQTIACVLWLVSAWSHMLSPGKCRGQHPQPLSEPTLTSLAKPHRPMAQK